MSEVLRRVNGEAFDFPLFFTACIFCRSMVTCSLKVRRFVPLLVAQPSTPKAPMNRGPVLGAFCRGRSGASAAVVFFLLTACVGASLKGNVVCRVACDCNDFQEPSKYLRIHERLENYRRYLPNRTYMFIAIVEPDASVPNIHEDAIGIRYSIPLSIFLPEACFNF